MQETILTPSVEKDFKKWFKKIANETGINDNPDDPLHHYDYRAAFLAGVKPDPEQGHHWPSEYKRYTHPTLIPDVTLPSGKRGLPFYSPTGQSLAELMDIRGNIGSQADLEGANPNLPYRKRR
jgi:hypothetical protein